MLVDEAISYRDETQRDDNAHKARLQRRRDALEASIRRARELMHDWPISDREIEAARVRERQREAED